MIYLHNNLWIVNILVLWMSRGLDAYIPWLHQKAWHHNLGNSPYTGVDRIYDTNKVSQAVATIRGYAGVLPDESALMVVVAQQPVGDAQLTLHLIFNILNQESNEDIAGLASIMLLLLLVMDKLGGATWDSEELVVRWVGGRLDIWGSQRIPLHLKDYV